jgi:predicted phage terminase large subunit-like protein
MLLNEGIELDFALHEAQALIHESTARFKVVAAGRRFGKSFLACITLLLEALKDEHTGVSGQEYDLKLKEVWYVAPTFEQAKGIMWPLLKVLGQKLIASTHENTATCTLINGRRIAIKGSDRPDTLRGRGLSYVVLDEFAFMKEDVWEKIIRPALSDVEGRALFIGTPEGKNHFFELFNTAAKLGLPEWQAFQFKSVDNPTLAKSEILAAKDSMSTENFRQEYEASFTEGGGKIFKEEWWELVEEAPGVGDYVIAIDLAGFAQEGVGRKGVLKMRDEHAIAVVYAGTWGWFVEDIIHGQWDVRRTALEIVSAYRDYRPQAIGIEKGMAKNAVMGYLEDEMKRLSVFFTPHELSHGNKSKPERIKWALQGRAEKGRIYLKKGAPWVRQFIEQANDFPSSLSHDDLIDAVAYADQLANTVYFQEDESLNNWFALDEIAGF